MQLLQREMKDPRVGFATITRVETAATWVSAGSGSACYGTADGAGRRP